jgi:hypothetical protein
MLAAGGKRRKLKELPEETALPLRPAVAPMYEIRMRPGARTARNACAPIG